MNNKALQRHLLTANTSTVANTVIAIEEYFAVGSPEQSSCNAPGEEASNPQMEKFYTY